MGDLVAPVESLAIEISQGSEGTRCEKAAASILNGALHAALFIAPRRAAGPGWRSGSGPRVPRSGDGSGWHRRGAPEPRCGDCRTFVPLRVMFPNHERGTPGLRSALLKAT